ncbi:MAG: PepSY domain-containing protein [Magnetospirillum sp.]|nr:PepSY domain-containing protein [Magnetospirillum sp.]
MKTAPLVAFALLFASPGPLCAEEDHDRALRAMEAGEILPLQTILDRVQADAPGEIVGTELEEEGGRPVYEIRVIAPDGRVLKLLYDARDGTLLRMRGGPRR